MNCESAFRLSLRRFIRWRTGLFFCLLALHAVPSADASPDNPSPLQPGRYVLITQGDAVFDPIIVNVIPKDGGFELSVENPQFIEPMIKTDSGSVVIRLTRKMPDASLRDVGASPREYLMTFAGVPSESVSGAIAGTFSSIYYYNKANHPGGNMGTFLLFPITEPGADGKS